MPQFAYKAMQHDGVLTEGLLEAGNRQEAMRLVEGRGLRPIKLAESAAAAKKAPAARGPAKSGGDAASPAAPGGGAVSVGGRATVSRKACRSRSGGAAVRIRRPSAWAASPKTGSLSKVSAWSGVLERSRRVQVTVLSGASKVISMG